jgi:hypothetical protein
MSGCNGGGKEGIADGETERAKRRRSGGIDPPRLRLYLYRYLLVHPLNERPEYRMIRRRNPRLHSRERCLKRYAATPRFKKG